MGLNLGLVGLPNAGKSTLFNALTRGHAATAAYPFTTTDRNVGVAAVEDARLTALAALLNPERIIPTSLEIVDIAGLVQGAHDGEGLGNQFLSHIFGVDALLHVVRCFDDANVAHPMSTVEPSRDVEIIATELLLKDLEMLTRRTEKEQKLAKGGEKRAQQLCAQLSRWSEAVSAGTPIRRLGLAPADHPRACGLELLTAKPTLYIANVGEAALSGESTAVAALRTHAEQEGARMVVCCAKLEAELMELDTADQTAMMQELGLSESALPQVIREGHALLRLLTFFTAANNILQAWTVAEGTTAPQAAGTIHTDFERRFIRAEVIQVDELVRCGSESGARAKGLLRLEGKDYVVRDGDVMHFRVG